MVSLTYETSETLPLTQSTCELNAIYIQPLFGYLTT